MSASFVISTQDMDRSGEIVETSGIRTDSHRLNPVVLWDHGRGPIGRLPIGQCQDPSGNYTIVTRSAEGIAVARVYFSKSLPFATDVFKLVQEGIIRGASIGFRAIDADPMPGYEHAGENDDPPLRYREVELCELSLTAVPDNPRSLAIKVNKAFGGRKPSKEMRQALVAHGFTIEEEKPMAGAAKPKTLGKTFFADMKSLNESGLAVLSKALASITGKSADDYLKMDDGGKLKDGEAAEGKKDGMSTTSGADGDFLADDVVKKADDGVPPPPDAPAEDVPSYKQPLDGPPSQAAATDLHTQLAGVAEAIQGWAARQENEQFKALAQEAAEKVDELMGMMASFHDNTHPDAEPLGPTPEEADAANEPESDEDEVKKSARLKLKAAPHLRLEKRLKIFRAKSAKSKVNVSVKKLGKSDAVVITKAASFLAKIEGDGNLDETLQAAGGFHAKALGQIAKGAAGDDGIDAKALQAQVEKAQADATEYRLIAEKAVKRAEEADANNKILTKRWNEFKTKNWQLFK